MLYTSNFSFYREAYLLHYEKILQDAVDIIFLPVKQGILNYFTYLGK